MSGTVLIVGAGILGLSSAYHIKKNEPRKRVVVIERNSSPGQGNTAKSNAMFRNVFGSETNFLLADTTIDWFFHLQNVLGYDLNLYDIGYLWFFSESQYESTVEAFNAMKDRGVELKTFTKEDLRRMIPDLVTDLDGDEEAELLGLGNVEMGVLGVKCGSLDADALVRSYESEFLKLGGEVIYNTNATRLIRNPEEELDIPGEPFLWQNSHISGVETTRGEIQSDTTIVATGVWSPSLLDPIGFDSLMRPKKRQLYVIKDERLKGLFAVEGFNQYRVLPFVVLPKSDVFLRTQISEGSFWVGCSDNFGRKFGLEDDPQPEEDFYTEDLYQIIVKYFPCFKDIRPVNMWAGQYAINSFDEVAIIAPAPGMIYVGAASGSGIMKCDALGRIAAALYAGEEEAELFGGRRFRVSDIGISERKVKHETFVL